MNDIFNSGLLIYLLVGIGIFFLMREVVCWYWKVNETNSLLREILTELRKGNATISSTTTNQWECPDCQTLNPNSTYECTKCGLDLNK
ncbi:MAG: hypothetical protein EPO24_04005 [Bacteroidetes bacterium]|nr:MAG: hypothetical protein EPO24_04005 [Bacteroidota bacterium]